jgi:hypothetical protein
MEMVYCRACKKHLPKARVLGKDFHWFCVECCTPVKNQLKRFGLWDSIDAAHFIKEGATFFSEELRTAQEIWSSILGLFGLFCPQCGKEH